MRTRMIAKVEQLIRTADMTGIDTVACGDRACGGQMYRFKIQNGEGRLLCADCDRVSVRFMFRAQEDGKRN